jgi:hypothetical protein
MTYLLTNLLDGLGALVGVLGHPAFGTQINDVLKKTELVSLAISKIRLKPMKEVDEPSTCTSDGWASRASPS